LIEVSRGSTKKIYFTKGHGEHAVADNTERGLKQFVDNLKSEGYQTDEIVLAEHKEMPADAQALVVAGPVAALTDGEVKLVKEWIEKAASSSPWSTPACRAAWKARSRAGASTSARTR